MAVKTTKGKCMLCGYYGNKAGMTRHLKTCAAKNDPQRGARSNIFHLRVEGAYSPLYWLDLEMGAKARLTDLDEFLREIWLECCEHMSAFTFGQDIYTVPLDEPLYEDLGAQSMDISVGRLFSPIGTSFIYEYDFGSTTRLKLRVQGEREGVIHRPFIRLLARNEAPEWKCAICSQRATLICPLGWGDEDLFSCDEHAHRHEGCDGESFLPVVNSPRMGVCAYEGPIG